MRLGLLLFGTAIGLVGIAGAVRRRSSPPGGSLLFFGTQADEPGCGIVTARLDNATGALTSLGLAAEAPRPTWLLHDPGRNLLLAVNELGNAGDCEGAVQSFAVDAGSGRLRPLSRTGSGGGGATHLDLAPDGRTLFVANFGGGEVSALPVAPDGTLGRVRSVKVNSGSGPHRRQQGPHAHGVTLDPSGRFLLVPDMGADRVFVYRFDRAAMQLEPAKPPFVEMPPGSGPRLVVFGPSGRFAYLLTELSAEIFAFRWNAGQGNLTQIGRLALDAPAAEGPPSAAALMISHDGRRLYASNRHTNEIQVYALDRASGLPREMQRVPSGGIRPWDATLSPDGRWLVVANQGSDNVTVFAVNLRDGMLTPTRTALSVPVPTSVVFAGAVP